MMASGEKVWIIGGSSGIGEALARAYAARGRLVVISGRVLGSHHVAWPPSGQAE